jgi:hypothetical protein
MMSVQVIEVDHITIRVFCFQVVKDVFPPHIAKALLEGKTVCVIYILENT